MKTRVFWWIAAMIPSFACGGPIDDREVSVAGDSDDTVEFTPAEIGENKQGLVSYDGGYTWVPACSVKKSRCNGTVNYEQCAWSVERPGLEDWLAGGSCDSGYRCEQQNAEARCVSTGGGGTPTRTIRCDEYPNDELWLTISGNPLSGGLRSDPPWPRHITYAGGPIVNENGWQVPPPSGTARDYVVYGGGNGPWALSVETTVTDLTPYMTDLNTPSRGSFFDLGNNVWQVSGGCTVQPDANSSTSYHLHRTKVPGSGGGGGGTSGGPGTIWCDYTGNNVIVTITGPFDNGGRLLGYVSSGVLEYGSNTPLQWNVLQLASGRATTSWTNNSGSYVMTLPANADEFNFYAAPSANAVGAWFNLRSDSSWHVGGDCYVSDTKLFVRR